MNIKTNSFDIAIYKKGDEKSKKMAVVLPGKLDTKDYANMRGHVDFLAENGFFAVSIDPPGTWDSGGDIGLYNMTNYIKAVDEVIEYFGNKQTIAIGHSMGGTMAMFVATKNPNVVGFVAIMSPYKFDHLISRLDKAVSKRGIPDTIDEYKVFNVPKSFFEDVLKYNATKCLSLLNKPKLFIYGEKDTTITPDSVQEIYKISSNPKEIIGLDSGHNYRHSQKQIDEVNDIIGNFLTNNFI